MQYKRLLTLVSLFNLFAFYGQDLGQVNGRLLLNDLDSKESVSQNTYVILKSKTYRDSIKVDNDLKFVFKNILSDTIRLYVYPRSYPNDKFYRFYLNKGEIKDLELPYSPTCPYGKSDTCPVCHKKDSAIPIVYGFIIEGKRDATNKKNYKPGGCVVSACQPAWYCERDKIDF